MSPGRPSKGLVPREMMELAVSVMTRSHAEPREDGKASPRVGAVLVKGDGEIDTASRGELRDGDHAEYTVLERKNRSSKLDDAVLFTTLEPCAPGSRRHPKLSCAERIVLARIKEVWIGLEDPDPSVDRKGIKHLQDSGVTVHMFDRDLQETILETNRAFIDQAEERASAARVLKQVEPVVLSRLEEALGAVRLQDLEKQALDEYRVAVGASDLKELNRRLLQQGLLRQQGGKLVPSGFGLLLFGKAPRARMPQAGLLGTIHYAEGREETRDFDGPAVAAPAQAIEWLRDKLPNPIDRTGAKRREVNQALFELLREGIVNSLVHRDYGIEGAKCQLIAHPEKIVVMSPGLPVAPITMEHLEAFDAPDAEPESHAALRVREDEARGGARARAQVDEVPCRGRRAPAAVLFLQGAIRGPHRLSGSAGGDPGSPPRHPDGAE